MTFSIHRLLERRRVARTAFLDAMSMTAATVNVVTTDGPNGRAGMTVSAMSSVSADTARPSMLVCLDQSSSSAQAILGNAAFCVNILREDQAYVSDVFAGRTKTGDGDKFSCTDWVVGKTGAPRMRNPLVAFDCRIAHVRLIGTHHVVFGEVEDTFVSSEGNPLIYAKRSYARLAERAQPVSANAKQGGDHAYNNAA